MVFRVFVEKKPGLDNDARALLNDAKTLLGIEGLQVSHLFAETDVTHGDLELVGYTEHHSTLGCSVQFGDSQRADLRSSSELPRLLKSILTS